MTRPLLFGCVLAGALSSTGCSSSSPAGPRELKLAYVMDPGGPAHEAAEYFARLVEEKSAGRLRVKLYPSAQLGNDRELVEGLSIGSVDMVLGGTAPVGWYLPQYGAIEAPFAFRDYEHLDHVLHGKIGREIATAFADQRGILILDWWHRGPRYLTTNRRVTKPADLAGLKLRVPELPTYIEAWRILGANPTPITYSEIFMALKQGIVEGQENPLEVIYTSSFHEAQKYVMKTEHLLGAYMLMVSRALFDGLPPDQKEAVYQAAVEAGRKEHELMVRYDEEFSHKLREAGMEFVEVDREAFREAVVKELPKRFADKWAPDLFQRIADVP
jgi:tripartite ATP-independent transporter DctP family solute receptor